METFLAKVLLKTNLFILTSKVGRKVYRSLVKVVMAL